MRSSNWKVLSRDEALFNSWLLTPLRKILVQEGNEGHFLWRVAEPVVRVVEAVGKRDRRPAAEIFHHYHGVHVRFPAYCWGIPQLGRDEPHRSDHILLSFRLALAMSELRQHRRRAESSAPRSEILRRIWELRNSLDVIVDVARIDILPLAILEIPEEPRARRLEEI